MHRFLDKLSVGCLILLNLSGYDEISRISHFFSLQSIDAFVALKICDVLPNVFLARWRPFPHNFIAAECLILVFY